MSLIIHRNGTLYREWSTIADGYTTDPMTRGEMAEYLEETSRARSLVVIAQRLAQADDTGTSVPGDTRDATRWDTPRCPECATFHHEWTPRGDGTCARCGEPEDDIAHAPPCGGTP